MVIKANYPIWALKHKQPGTELRLIKRRYYLYAVTSKWNKEKKRAQKITGKLLGRITEEDGFVRSASKSTPELPIKEMSVKSWCTGLLVESLIKEVLIALKKHFGSNAEALYCASLMRLVHQSPLKNMELHFRHDFLSESFPTVYLADKKMTSLLRTVGEDREKVAAFLKEFTKPGEHILMDMTAIHSKSKEMSRNVTSYNSQGCFDPQANLLLLFSQTQHGPVYYRLLPGNIRDVKSVKISLK